MASVQGSPSDFSRQEPASLEQPPVQRAELDRLQHLIAADVLLAREVGEGIGDLEDAVVGAGGEIHLLHVRGQLAEIDQRDFDVDVDTI